MPRNDTRPEILWQYSWSEGNILDPDGEDTTRTIRVVSWRLPFDDGKISVLHIEERSEDCMGVEQWHHAEGRLPQRALFELMQHAGFIHADEIPVVEC